MATVGRIVASVATLFVIAVRMLLFRCSKNR
nr:MAG TPA: hypothetical protein [Caudoviricetes sp.]DAH10833.1 MAG TPA: hypothetical protein [Caudoviricetes sp.]